jgi:hypothetical protein
VVVTPTVSVLLVDQMLTRPTSYAVEFEPDELAANRMLPAFFQYRLRARE